MNSLEVTKSIAQEQNPETNRNNKSSFMTTVINLLKSAIGSSIVIFPTNFYNGGYLATTFQTLFYSLLVMYLVFSQCDVTESYFQAIHTDNDETQDENRPKDDQDFRHVISTLYGENWVAIYNLSVAALCLINALIYGQIIYKSIISACYAMGIQLDHSICFFVFAMIIIIISVVFDDYEKMKLTSMIGVLIVFTTMIVFNVYSFQQINDGFHQNYSDQLIILNPTEQFMVSANILYSFEYITNVNYLRKNMKQPQDFKKSVMLVHLIGFIFCTSFGILVSYSLQTPPNDIFYLDYNQKKQHWVFIFQQLFVLIIISSFPINVSPFYFNIENTQFYRSIQDPGSQTDYLRRNFAKILLALIVIGFIGMIDFKVNMIACLLSPFFIYVIQFLIPVITYNKYFQQSQVLNPSQKYLNISIVILGALVSLLATKDSIIKLTK